MDHLCLLDSRLEAGHLATLAMVTLDRSMVLAMVSPNHLAMEDLTTNTSNHLFISCNSNTSRGSHWLDPCTDLLS